MLERLNFSLPDIKIQPSNQSNSKASTWFSFRVFFLSFCIFCVVGGVTFLVVKGVVRMCLWWQW
ncbi:hypothetical protein ES288_A07G152900v1 [Gossypium darwinii]|uniref:Uncharacterized protein n=2 Tax=Gossypium TaxID=3633 RepID=A0A5D2PSW0_GOSTO|nr:hypothetical protein ES288_A07G152900v1 [Gossypium darwinii]TYI19258.1 hypothetical protein ES332_A07G152800v1 [Gossypium tomentosum]